MAFNKVILMGNLTSDPEQRSTPTGQTVTVFTLAVNRNYKGSDGERHEDTAFIECNAWGNAGSLISQYVSKGRQLLVCGRLQQRRWEDKETGRRRSALNVVVEEFSFVNDGRGGSSRTASAAPQSATVDTKPADGTDIDVDEPIDLSDIPF